MNNSNLTNSKQKRKSIIRNLLDSLEKSQQKIPAISKPPQIYLNPEEIRKNMRKSWRDGGYGNRQFGQIHPIKAKVLNSWQIQRIPLSKRSYSSPKTFKGLKYDCQSRQFIIKSQAQLHSERFTNYLKTAKQKYENTLFLPRTTQINRKIQKIKQISKHSGMKFRSTSQIFGISSKLSNLNTLKSFKSQIFKKRQFFS